MAVFTGDEVNIGTTATLVIAAKTDRRSLVLRVTNGEVWFGPTSGVTVEGGLHWTKDDDPIVDNIPALGDWYAIARSGTSSARVSYGQIADT